MQILHLILWPFLVAIAVLASATVCVAAGIANVLAWLKQRHERNHSVTEIKAAVLHQELEGSA